MANNKTREFVQEWYGRAVKVAVGGGDTSCRGAAAIPSLSRDRGFIDGTHSNTRELYSSSDVAEVPADAIASAFGCGNPTSLAELRPGEIVLDLGSGGGIDVLLAGRRVGATGKVYGLDMTPEMLEVARANQAKAGATNVEFLQGTMEAIPLASNAVNVIISNCAINLSTDKDQVFRQAFRVLAPGGRLALSDLVLGRELTEAVKKNMALWAGCLAGALFESDYRAKLAAAGFTDITVEPTRVHGHEDSAEILPSSSCCAGDAEAGLAGLDGAVMSVFIRAKKPVLS